MSSAVYERVRKNPKFQELVERRTKFAIMLSAIVMVGYYGFMMVVAFAPQVLATPISATSPISIGWPIGAAIIVISWVLTGWYASRANGEFDAMNEEILKEAHR